MKTETFEEFAQRHFPGIEKEAWYPPIIAIGTGYIKYLQEQSAIAKHEDKKVTCTHPTTSPDDCKIIAKSNSCDGCKYAEINHAQFEGKKEIPIFGNLPTGFEIKFVKSIMQQSGSATLLINPDDYDKIKRV